MNQVGALQAKGLGAVIQRCSCSATDLLLLFFVIFFFFWGGGGGGVGNQTQISPRPNRDEDFESRSLGCLFPKSC